MPWWFVLLFALIAFNYLPDFFAFLLMAGVMVIFITQSKHKAKPVVQNRLPKSFQHWGLLNHYLYQQQQKQQLSSNRYQWLQRQLQRYYQTYIQKQAPSTEQLNQAWRDLQQAAEIDLGKPPWAAKQQRQLDLPLYNAVETQIADSDFELPSVPTPAKPEPVKTKPPIKPSPKPVPQPVQPQPKHKPRGFVSTVLLPFLRANIGWFIGSFCLLSGSVFLIMTSRGFTQSFLLLANLGLYSGLLFWGGYKLQQKRPDLRLTADILLILAVLFVPLVVSVTVRLLAASSGGFEIIVALSSVALITALYKGVRLSSAIFQRELQQSHARLLLALSLSQVFLLIPNAAISVYLAHAIILLLLTYAWHLFAHQWLQTLFMDKQKTAYYASGTLLYSALVAFIHVSWGSGVSLSNGYFGVAFILLSLFLAYADVQLQQWVKRYVLLSYVTFVIYALSVLAVLLSAYSQPHLIVVLGLSVLLYGWLLLRYLSPPVLYLLLLSSAGLYTTALLTYVPWSFYLFASLPLLFGYKQLQTLLNQRHAQGLALIVERVLFALILVLTGFSLYHSQASVFAMLIPFVAAAFIWYSHKKIAQSLSVYAGVFLITLSFAYAPVVLGNGLLQFSLVSTLLAGIWLGLQWLKPNLMLVYSVIFNSLLACSLCVWLPPLWQVLLLSLNAVLWFSLSLQLLVRPFLYVALGLVGIVGGLIKWYYVDVSSGYSLILIALLLWVAILALKYQRASKTASKTLTLFKSWQLTCYADYVSLLLTPLRQVFALLGGVAWLIWLLHPAHFELLPLLLISGLTLLLAGEFRVIGLVMLSLLTLFGAGVSLALALNAAYSGLLVTTYAWALFILYQRAHSLLPVANQYFKWHLPPATPQRSLSLLFQTIFISCTVLTIFNHISLAPVFLLNSLSLLLVAGWFYRQHAASVAMPIHLSLAVMALFNWHLLPDNVVELLLALQVTAFAFYYSQRHNNTLNASTLVGLGLALLTPTVSLLLALDSHYFAVKLPLELLFTLLLAASSVYVLLLQKYQLIKGIRLVFAILSTWGLLISGGFSLAFICQDEILVIAWFAYANGLYYVIHHYPKLFNRRAYVTFQVVFRNNFIGILTLLSLCLLSIGAWMLMDDFFNIEAYVIGLAVLTAISAAHLYQQKANSWVAHVLIVNVSMVLVVSLLDNLSLSLINFVWLLGLFVAYRVAATTLKQALAYWQILAFTLGLVLLVVEPRWLHLVLLSLISFGFYYQNRRSTWLLFGQVLAWLSLHTVWLIGQSWSVLPDYYALFSLQNALLAAGFFYAQQRHLLPASQTTGRLLLIISSVFLVLNSSLLLQTGQLSLGAYALMFSSMGLLGFLYQQQWPQYKAIIIVLFSSLALISTRFLIFGNSALTVWDSASLLVLGGLCLALYQHTPRRLYYGLSLGLPLLSLLSIPFHSGALMLSSGLILTSLFYFTLSRHSATRLPFYLGVIGLNLSVYLWLPQWSAQTQLQQWYLMPAALTVLIMVQLHKDSLQANLAHQIRLFTLGLVYASASLDVFLRPELSVFIAVIALSLFGIMMGIYLKNRAFLYSGTAFLCLNIGAQLLLMPQTGFAKALILIALGLLITGGMLLFNLKRASFEQKWREWQ